MLIDEEAMNQKKGKKYHGAEVALLRKQEEGSLMGWLEIMKATHRPQSRGELHFCGDIC